MKADAVGRTRIGLHASADPIIGNAEFDEFTWLKPDVIKVLSSHPREALTRFRSQFPESAFIVRAFLDFGGRQISAEQFVNDTLLDVKRAVQALQGAFLVVEVHNEPNLTSEGLGASWGHGGAFADWFRDAVSRFRTELPETRFLYPGLSPGETVPQIRQNAWNFLVESEKAVEAADGLGIHAYWSNADPIQNAVTLVDEYMRVVPDKAIWITEASNNKIAPSAQRADEYIRFWKAMHARPRVQGITYFVASGSNPAFANETWLGKGIAQLVGQR